MYNNVNGSNSSSDGNGNKGHADDDDDGDDHHHDEATAPPFETLPLENQSMLSGETLTTTNTEGSYACSSCDKLLFKSEDKLPASIKYRLPSFQRAMNESLKYGDDYTFGLPTKIALCAQVCCLFLHAFIHSFIHCYLIMSITTILMMVL